MLSVFGMPISLLADASASTNSMRDYLLPVIGTFIGVASIAVVFFLVLGGIQYMTSAGNPERLEHAKKILKNALIGVVIVIASITLTGILSQAYNSNGNEIAEKLPTLQEIKPQEASGGLVDVLIKAIVGLLKNIIESVGKPFLSALDYFTNGTPLMADNSGVFNLWLALVGISDVLFILVIALLGFHIMSYASLGLEEVEFRHLLPRLGLIFLLINSSIFAIDAIIALSNGMIAALNAGFPHQSVWEVLQKIVDETSGMSLAALLLMIVFVIISVMLLVYYVLRLVVLFIGAVLSPLIFLVWLLPPFKDFAESAMKTYITTIFVLFVHVVILQLAASIFTGMSVGAAPGETLNPLMAMIVGVATLIALLKTQSVMSQMSYASLGPRTASKLGGQLTNVISHYGRSKFQTVRAGKQASRSAAGKAGTSYRSSSSTMSKSASKATVMNSKTKAAKDVTKAKLPTGRTKAAPKISKEKKL